MRKNSVSVALLAAVMGCSILQGASYAQGGVLMPEHAVPRGPNVRLVPTTDAATRTESTASTTQTAAGANRAMPVPSIRPAARGHLIHVQNLNSLGPANRIPRPTPAPTAMRGPAEFSMGGFAPRAEIKDDRPVMVESIK